MYIFAAGATVEGARGCRLLAIAVAILVSLLGATPALSANRWALIIGISEYRDSQIRDLPNTVNDARTMSSALYNMGFEVYYLENSSKSDLMQTIDRIKVEQRGADLGLFYFSGHGVQVEGVNYALPADISPKGPDFLSKTGVSINEIIKDLKVVGSENLVIVLDSCRNSPFSDRAAMGTGLALIDAPTNTIVAYSTAPGTFAYDGSAGANSPYTAALASALEGPEQDIRDIFRLVRIRVRLATGGAQTPWYIDNSRGEITVQLRRKSADTVPLPEITSENVTFAGTAWRTIADSSDPRDFELFAKLFPNSEFAETARRQLASIGTDEKIDFPLMDLGLPDPNPEVANGLGSIVTACDVLATGVGDVLAVAEPVPHHLVNTRAALRACIEAVANDPENARLEGLLGRVLRLERRDAESLYYFTRAAERGNPTAYGEIAATFRQGRGVETNYTRAADAARRGAMLGSAPVRLFMGIFYREGWGVPQSFAEARRWTKLAADAGYAPALVAYGDFYRRGQGTARDPAAALTFYERAAALGSTDAMNLIGLAYLKGEGPERNVKLGLQWLSRASEEGNPFAAFHLGRAFFTGEGAERNIPQALAYFRLAAQRNYLGAYISIGDVLSQKTVDKKPNLSEAYANYVIAREAALIRDTIAAREELAEARSRLDALKPRMTADEIDKGDRIADDWIKQYGLLDFNLVNE